MKKTSQPVGRPREFDEDRVLDRVMNLFWAQGYEGTALADIVTATGLAKGSVYKAFQSKHNLYLKSLERYEDIYVNSAVAALSANDAPMARIDNFLSAPIKGVSPHGSSRGCFLCNASADRADADLETQALVKRSFAKLGGALLLPVAELKPDWSESQRDAFAQMLLSVYSGLRIMSRSGLDLDRLIAAKAGALAALR